MATTTRVPTPQPVVAERAEPATQVPGEGGGGDGGIKLDHEAVAAACCTPLARAPLSAAEADRLVAVLKAVAVSARLRLLSLIYAHEDAEACVCELTELLGLSQPTVSHHLKVLVDAGLLTRSKRGVWVYYRAVPGALATLAAALTPPGGEHESGP
jgi:ArsR family transcriptional regulator